MIMRSFQKVKGEWNYVYTTPMDGDDYALINKDTRFYTGLLEPILCKERGAG